MSKKTKATERPIYNTSSAIYVNGNKKASAESTQGGANAQYFMDENEQKLYDYAGKSLYDNLENINVFSDDTIKNLNSEVNAYLNRGIKTIESTYSPMILNMQNDVARRFGNTDNSIFMDGLKDIESMRAAAVSDLANSVEEKRSELVNNELSNRYNYLNFLNGIQKQIYSNMLSMLGTANDYLNSNNSQLNGKNSNNANSVNYAELAEAAAKIVGSFM